MTSGSRPKGPSGHVCWSYDDPATLDARAREYLLAGLAVGERVQYASAEPAGDVVRRWSADPRLREALRTGAAEVVSIADTYGDGTVDPTAQVAVYAAMTDAALADGHTGLRVVAEASSLVRTAAQRETFTRYEHLVDRFMRGRPMSAACAYDRRLLDDRAVEELASVHPAADPGSTLFHLHAAEQVDGRLVLTGELDTSNQELFATTLRRVDPEPGGTELVLDGDGLRFVDYRSLVHLHRHAERRGTTVLLRTTLGPAARLVELLGLRGIRVETIR
ncbi:MEDS domain-containing protein [Micromonospora sp. CPCC 205711]|uniref:MEDS domain-containing protein n=1 Tax=Micromonospora sp. CPCC 205547 TaxID=3122400 RepID=UPI002FF2B892